MRSVLEEVVLPGGLARLNVGNLLADLDERVAEAVELSARLGLGGLNHESSRDGETHGGGVEAVVSQTLGDIGNLNTSSLLEGTDIEDELVSTSSVGVGVDNLVVRQEARHDVVSVEESSAGLLGEAIAAHHQDVGVADGQDRGTTPGSSADRSNSSLSSGSVTSLRIDLRVAREIGGKVLLDSDRTNTRATTTVGDTEGLVEVQMADISTDVTRAAETDLGVHVGTVHVDETTVLVNKVAHLLDLGLENTKGTGVGDHDGGKLISVLGALGLEILNVQVTSLAVALDGDNLHAGHGSTGRIGTVGGDGDQTDSSLLTTFLGLVVSLDDSKTSKLTLSSRVGLESGGVHTSDLGQVLAERADQGLVARSLLDRGEGVHVGNAGVRDGKHLGGGVELHGARTQRDHGVHQRDILGLEEVDVSQELRLSVVLVEDGLLKVGRLSLEGRGDLVVEELGRIRLESGLELGLRYTEALDKVAKALQGHTLVQGEADLVLSNPAEVDALERSLLVDLGDGLWGSLEGNSIEQNRAVLADAVGVELELALLEDEALSKTGLAPDILGNGLETLGSVVDGVKGRHVGQKSLSSADVASGLLSSNVLLTGLKSETESGLAESVLGNTNKTAGNLTLVLLRGSKEGGMRTTVAQRNTKTLGVANGDVGTKLTRGLEDGQGEKISGSTEEGLLLVDNVGELLVIVDTTVGVGVLNESADKGALGLPDELAVVGEDVTNDEVNSETLSSRLKDGEGLRVAGLGNDKGLLALGARSVGHGHGHGLSGGSSLIKNGSIGDVKASKVGDKGLEVEQGLQTTLADLSLVGRVAGVPGRVLQNISLDNSRDLGTIVSSTDERLINSVVVAQLAHLLLDKGLRATIGRHRSLNARLLPLLNEVEALLLPPDLRGDGLLEELLHRAHGRVEDLEHLLLLGRLAANVPPREELMLGKLSAGLGVDEATGRGLGEGHRQ